MKTLFADLQIYGDPEAADVVFTSGANIVVVGINITTQVQFKGIFNFQFSSHSKPASLVLGFVIVIVETISF